MPVILVRRWARSIKGTNAADNGMTFTTMYKLGGGSDGGLAVDAAYVQVEGDFGKLILVTLKTVLHKFCQALLAVTKTSKVSLVRVLQRHELVSVVFLISLGIRQTCQVSQLVSQKI